MNHPSITVLILCAALLAPAATAAPSSVESVMACMRGNLPPTLRVRDIQLTTVTRAGGSETLRGKLYALREGGEGPLRAMLRIDAPPNLAGASYLLRQSDDFLSEGMYVYLPTVKRVRRISGTFADGALLGTNFSYSDFKQVESAFADADAVLESADEFNGRPVQVLRVVPRKPPDGAARTSGFSEVRLWVDAQTCVPVQATFFEREKARKRLTSPPGALQQSGKYAYLSVMEMEDLRDGSKTTLKILGVTSGGKVPAGYFDPKLFYLGN
jgi:hypothetical protein